MKNKLCGHKSPDFSEQSSVPTGTLLALLKTQTMSPTREGQLQPAALTASTEVTSAQQSNGHLL